MINYVGSSAHTIKLIPKETSASWQYMYADTIPVNKPALIVLGGSLTTNEHKAMGYIDHIGAIIRNKSNITVGRGRWC